MPRRRYTRKQKLSAVLAAEMSGVVATAEQTGIPESTIRFWADKPEFAAFCAKAREDAAHDVEIVMHLGWMRTAEALLAGTMEPRDALFAAQKATEAYQLLTGEATSRVETRELLNDFADHEIDAVENWLHDIARQRLEVPDA